MHARRARYARRVANTKRVVGVIELVILLMLAWSELSDRSARGSAFAAINVLVSPLLAIAVALFGQVVVRGTARLLGDRLAIISIGFGPVVIQRQMGEIGLVARAIPVGFSNVIASTRPDRQSLRRFAAAFSGVCALAGVTGLLASLEWHGAAALRATLAVRFAPDAVLMVAGAATTLLGFVVALNELAPPRARLDARRRLGAYFEANDHVKRGAYQQATTVARAALAKAPDDLVFQYVLAQALSMAEDAEAFERTEALVRRELSAQLRPAVLNQWAWAIYSAGRTDLRDEADRASAEALAGAPRNEHMLDTRGHVLLWLGRNADAEPLLRRAFSRASDPGTRTSSAAGLALLYAATDRPSEAATWLAKARAGQCCTQLVARAAAAVDPLRRS